MLSGILPQAPAMPAAPEDLCGASMVANMHHITMVDSEGVIFQNTWRVFLGKKACRELRGTWNAYWMAGEGAN